MPRVAFTIVLNGEHHLKHNDYFENMIPHFDKWVFAEGAVRPTGSTSWCKEISSEFATESGSSVDGTLNYLSYLKSKFPDKVEIIQSANGSFWDNKDVQVNACIAVIKKTHSEAFLWQMDVDEQWPIGNIKAVEEYITDNNYNIFSCKCHHFVGRDLIAQGGIWGSDGIWTRLWKWTGEYFISHEPPALNMIGQRPVYMDAKLFYHYSYYFECDVIFKSKFYGLGHEGVYEGWKKLRDMKDEEFPCNISVLFGNNKYSASIVKVKS